MSNKPEYAPTKDQHYTQCTIQPIEYIIANGWGEGFCIGNIIKYISRYNDKGGIDDLRKARNYIDYLITIKEDKV